MNKVVYIVQETSSDDVEFVFNTRKEAVEYAKQFDGVGTGYSFRIMEGIVWSRTETKESILPLDKIQTALYKKCFHQSWDTPPVIKVEDVLKIIGKYIGE